MKKNLLLTCVLGIVVSAVFYLLSPQRIATHFNSQGTPNGWMSKTGNLILWVTLYLFITGLYLGISRAFKNVPEKLVNLPNKKYWLSPEKKEETVQVMSDLLFNLGAACNIFFIVLELIVFKANMHPNPHINIATANVAIGGFIMYVIIWLIMFYRKFRRKEEKQ